jgi:hypothetical protein
MAVPARRIIGLTISDTNILYNCHPFNRREIESHNIYYVYTISRSFYFVLTTCSKFILCFVCQLLFLHISPFSCNI